MSKSFALWLLIIGVFSCFIAMPVSLSAKEITFRGRVIDYDTREPIEGAVVVASWLEARPTISGESTRLKDVKEIVTDKNGEWSISGEEGQPHTENTYYDFFTGTYHTRPPSFIIFKPGYCSWPAGFGIDSCKGKLKPSGNDKLANGETVELQRLTGGEDRLKVLPEAIGDNRATFRKQKQFMRLINEERINMGLSESTMYTEIINEQ